LYDVPAMHEIIRLNNYSSNAGSRNNIFRKKVSRAFTQRA